jgi:hypothetical protein
MKVRLKTDRLAQELAQRNVSMNLWATKLGIRSGHLSQLVNGKRRYPNPSTRQRLQDGLGLQFEDLFEVVLHDEHTQ